MKRHTLVPLGAGMLILGASFAAATHYGGPFVIEPSKYPPGAPLMIDGHLLYPENPYAEVRYQEAKRQAIGKEMIGGGVVASLGIFMSLLGSMREQKEKVQTR